MRQAGFEPATDGLKVRYATSASLALAVYLKSISPTFFSLSLLYIYYIKNFIKNQSESEVINSFNSSSEIQYPTSSSKVTVSRLSPRGNSSSIFQ